MRLWQSLAGDGTCLPGPALTVVRPSLFAGNRRTKRPRWCKKRASKAKARRTKGRKMKAIPSRQRRIWHPRRRPRPKSGGFSAKVSSAEAPSGVRACLALRCSRPLSVPSVSVTFCTRLHSASTQNCGHDYGSKVISCEVISFHSQPRRPGSFAINLKAQARKSLCREHSRGRGARDHHRQRVREGERWTWRPRCRRGDRGAEKV